MNPIFITYIGFVVAALILIWAMFEIMNRSRRNRRSKKNDVEYHDRWMRLDTSRQPYASPPERGFDAESSIRSKQNGHL